MKTNGKILIYDLFNCILGTILALWATVAQIQDHTYIYDKTLILCVAPILNLIFILNIYWYYRTKEKYISVFNIIIPFIVSIFAFPLSEVTKMNLTEINLVSFVSLYTNLISVRIFYNIGFYIKVRKKYVNREEPPVTILRSSIRLRKLSMVIFNYLPTLLLIVYSIIIVVMCFSIF